MVGSSEAHEERDNEYVPKLVWVLGGMRRRWATTGRMDETCPTILWRSQVSEKDMTSASKNLTAGVYVPTVKDRCYLAPHPLEVLCFPTRPGIMVPVDQNGGG